MKTFLGDLFIAALLILAAMAYVLWRRVTITAWKQAADRLGCAYEGGSPLEPGTIQGSYRERPLQIAASVSYEDGPGYHHTGLGLGCTNPGQVVLGVRRKSVLEAVSQRGGGETATGDADFDACFFTTVNDTVEWDRILTHETRQRMKRLDDLEVYVVDDLVTIRRAGSRLSADELVEMADMAVALGCAIDSLPVARRSSAQRAEDASLIAQGI